MKKTYMKPLAQIVAIQHTTLLMQSLESKTGGNADFNYVGGKGESNTGYSEGRVKEHSPWEDDW